MKKGFTLIEIIVCIGVLAVIGVSSFFGIRLINKNIKANKLEELNDKIKEAVSVYIETNKEAKNQLYSDENGVLVPLTVLQNEGLIDFQDINIDSKRDYVIAMLGSKEPSGACIDTTMIGSWEDGDKTIYLCTMQDGSTNISSIGFSGNNLSLTSKSRVWFYGNIEQADGIQADAEARANNYITYKNRVFKIYYIDRDDSLALVSYDSFGNLFAGKTQKISTDKRLIKESINSGLSKQNTYEVPGTPNGVYFPFGVNIINNGELPIGAREFGLSGLIYDLFLTKVSAGYNIYTQYADGFGSMSGWSGDGEENDYLKFLGYTGETPQLKAGYYVSFKNNNQLFKIQLKPCMKITGGNGDNLNPYILNDFCK